MNTTVNDVAMHYTEHGSGVVMLAFAVTQLSGRVHATATVGACRDGADAEPGQRPLARFDVA